MATTTMTKAERSELRSLIRQRFRVLRNDVEQRQSELFAELEVRINEKFAADDKSWADVAFLIQEAVLEADRKANDTVRDLVGVDAWPNSMSIVRAVDIASLRAHATATPVREQQQLRRTGHTRIEATIKAAQLQLDRQEADLLTQLTLGALESDAARAFLEQIPTVGALVPTARLLELEQSFGGAGA